MSTDCQHATGPCLTRRAVLAVGSGFGAVALAACAGDSGGGSGTEEPAVGESLGNVADVPVGGALAAETSDGTLLLLTQPTEGEVLAFSAVCTHQGCTVEAVDGGLDCPCHGSTFDLTTGEPTGGPAEEPLPSVAIEVADDGSITTA